MTVPPTPEGDIPEEVIRALPSYAEFFRGRTPDRELFARSLAGKIVTIFGITLVGALAAGFVITVLVLFHPEQGTIAEQVATAYLRGVTTLAATVFGPLLAFILGYYFGEKRGKD